MTKWHQSERVRHILTVIVQFKDRKGENVDHGGHRAWGLRGLVKLRSHLVRL